MKSTLSKPKSKKVVKETSNGNQKVYFTKDLDIFQFHPINRDRLNSISERRIKRIVNSMMSDGLLLHPILVSSNMFVVDGQHRLEAAKKAKKGIYYIVDESVANTPEGIFEAAQKLNRDAKEWAKKDYLHGFSMLGKEEYKILDEFNEKFPHFSLTENMMFMNNSANKRTGKFEFAKGEFKNGNVEIAYEWAERITSLKPYFPQGYNKSSFVRAMIKIFETKPEFEWRRFIHKVSKKPDRIHLCGDMRSYTVMIEEIYNHGSHEETRLNLRW